MSVVETQSNCGHGQHVSDRHLHPLCDRKAEVQQLFAFGLLTLLTTAKDIGLVYDLAFISEGMALLALLFVAPPRGIWPRSRARNANKPKVMSWITTIKAILLWKGTVLCAVGLVLMIYGAVWGGMFASS